MKNPPLVRCMLVRDSGRRLSGPLEANPEARPVSEPSAVAALLRAMFPGLDREQFVCVMVNARQQVIGVNVVSVGTLTASLVHPRECFKPAILANAAAVIVAHNHPSGQVQPSPEDRETTSRLVRAGRLLGIEVLDHVIWTEAAHFSFRSEGLL